jgi:hypothetical protein
MQNVAIQNFVIFSNLVHFFAPQNGSQNPNQRLANPQKSIFFGHFYIPP